MLRSDERRTTDDQRRGVRPRGWSFVVGRRSVAGLLALFISLCLIYNANVPLGEGPDEPGHLAYVLFLAREGRLPVQGAGPAESDVPGEGHQPPLAYLLAAPAVAWLPADDRQIVLTANRTFVWAGGDQPAAFMRGSREYWPWRGSTLVWRLARAVSALWGALTVLFTYLAARALWPGRRDAPLLAAALVAFNPQFLFSCALVSNDPLLAALSAATLWRCLALAGRPAPGWPQVTLLGLLFGLALLTKQSALLLGPLLLWAGWRAGRGDLRRGAGYTLVWGITAMAVAGWWYLRNLRLYGDPFGAAMFSAEFAGQPFAWGDLQAWMGALGQLFGSFWARFGWMTVSPPAWALGVYGAIVGLAVIGWGLGLRHRESGAGGRGRWAGPLILLGMAIVWILFFAATAGLVAWQGRMLFPAIGAIGILLTGGLIRVSPRAFYLAPAACGLSLALYMPFGVIAPAYPWAVLPEAQARAELGDPTYIRYAHDWERGVVLRGWRLGGPAAPGAELPITLTWNSLEPVPRSWTVFIELRDDSGQTLARTESRPRDASLPFTYWTPGDWVADRHVLRLPASLPPGSYRLIVGLYRPEKDNIRLPAWAEDGGMIGDEAVVGEVLVGP